MNTSFWPDANLTCLSVFIIFVAVVVVVLWLNPWPFYLPSNLWVYPLAGRVSNMNRTFHWRSLFTLANTSSSPSFLIWLNKRKAHLLHRTWDPHWFWLFHANMCVYSIALANICYGVKEKGEISKTKWFYFHTIFYLTFEFIQHNRQMLNFTRPTIGLEVIYLSRCSWIWKKKCNQATIPNSIDSHIPCSLM